MALAPADRVKLADLLRRASSSDLSELGVTFAGQAERSLALAIENKRTEIANEKARARAEFERLENLGNLDAARKHRDARLANLYATRRYVRAQERANSASRGRDSNERKAARAAIEAMTKPIHDEYAAAVAAVESRPEYVAARAAFESKIRRLANELRTVHRRSFRDAK